MRGVRFGEIHTGENWSLILNAKSLQPPTIKSNYISVDGRDGRLDFTEALTGEVKYENRTASFVFIMVDGTYQEREDQLTEIINYLHGNKFEIVSDDDPDYYLVGRCSVKEYTNDKTFGTITVECICDPWRYSVSDTVRFIALDNGEGVLTCKNGGSRSLTPEITIDGTITITVDDRSIELTTGTYKLLDYKLRPGVTVFNVEGTGSVKLVYKEAVI